MEFHLKIIGFNLVVLAIIHVAFPRYFNWQNELGSLSLMNKQMIYVHTFFIALIIFLLGVLCISSSKELIETNLGKRICCGIALFCITRLAIQFFGYSSKLWRGKTFETIIHILFVVIWTYFSCVFCIIGSG